MTLLESAPVGGDDSLNMLQRRGAAALGLGWLIAIVICGGVSLFICVGFALVWRTQKRHTPLTITHTTASLPYELSGLTAMLSGKVSTTRLTKRGRLTATPRRLHDEDDDDSMTLGHRLSSRFTLKHIHSAPMLPPLPSYSTFRLWNPRRVSYRRETGWLDEEAVTVGDQTMVTMRLRPGSGSGWAGRTVPRVGQNPPVLPPVGHRAMRQGIVIMAPGQQRQQQQPQKKTQPPATPLHQKPTNSDNEQQQRAQHNQKQKPVEKEEEMSMPAKPGAVYAGDASNAAAARGWVRPAAAVLAKHPTRTDSELRDILRSTEQRLRDGDRSRSPEKRTPVPVSPTKRAAATPRHSNGGGGGRVSHSASGSGMGVREGSAASIGSAANSLIEHATEELQLPGGMGSPSRLRGHEWLAGDDAILLLTSPILKQQQEDMERASMLLQQQQQQQHVSPKRSPQRSPQRERRRSHDSDVSSSLSTLYSVGDDDTVGDVSTQAVVEGPNDDPFVERRPVHSDSLLSVLAPLRRTTTGSSETLAADAVPSSSPSVQRNPSARSTHRSLDVQRFAGVLQPPAPPVLSQYNNGTDHDDDVCPKSASSLYAGALTSPQFSESSFTDMSVNSATLSVSSSDDDDDDEDDDGMMTPKVPRRRGSDASSSPFSEQDIVDMMMAAQSPTKGRHAQRALPVPPGLPVVVAPDGSVVPTPLSPPPMSGVSRTQSLQRQQHRRVAGFSPVVRQQSVTSSCYSNNSGYKNNNSGNGVATVGNSVAQLRRMNSIVSVISSNSAVEPLLSLADGRAPPPSSQGGPRYHHSRMGSRQYLSVGGGGSGSTRGGKAGGPGKRMAIGRPSGPRPPNKSAGAGGGYMRRPYSTTAAALAAPEPPAKSPRRSLGNVGSRTERYQPYRPPPSPQQQTDVEKQQENDKENAGLGITRAQSLRHQGQTVAAATAARLQESRVTALIRDAAVAARASSPSPLAMRRLKNPVVAELAAAAERRAQEGKRGSVDSLGLYDKDGFLLPSPEREVHKKLLRM